MGRKSFCQACSNARFGVKTRLSVGHTCGLGSDELQTAKAVSEYNALRAYPKPIEVEDPLSKLRERIQNPGLLEFIDKVNRNQIK